MLDVGLRMAGSSRGEAMRVPVAVMIVDDSRTLVRALGRFLTENYRDDVTVVGAADGCKEALAKAQELRPQVILLDLATPGMHGLEAVPRLREVLPDACIIAMSVSDFSQYREASLAAGADDFVPKAMLGTHLLPAIWRALQGSRWRGTSGEVPEVVSR